MPLYEYHCKKCLDDREYLVPGVHADPLACKKCGAVGQLERLAVQPFSIGKNRAGSTVARSKSVDSEEMAAACGGQKICTLIKSTPCSINKYSIWKIPQAGRN